MGSYTVAGPNIGAGFLVDDHIRIYLEGSPVLEEGVDVGRHSVPPLNLPSYAKIGDTLRIDVFDRFGGVVELAEVWI